MDLKPQIHTADPSQSPERQFELLGQRFVLEWAKFGVNVVLSRSDNFHNFRNASKKIQKHAISYLEFNLNLIREMVADGYSPRNTRLYLWRALKKLSLAPPSNFTQFIDDEDVIELYSQDEIQMFRSVNFLETTHLSLEDILCLPWFQTTKRSWKSLLAMTRTILKFKLGMITDIVPWGIPEHVVEEIGPLKRRRVSLHLKYLIPLRGDGKMTSCIVTMSAKVLPS